MCAQVLSVKTFLMNGFVSPVLILAMGGTKNIYSRTLSSDHIRDLNDGVDVRLGEDALTTGTFYIETQNSKWCCLRPLTIRCVRDEVVPPNHSEVGGKGLLAAVVAMGPETYLTEISI